jgi:hypothetical protein
MLLCLWPQITEQEIAHALSLSLSLFFFGVGYIQTYNGHLLTLLNNEIPYHSQIKMHNARKPNES